MKLFPEDCDSVSVLGLGRCGMAVIEYFAPRGVRLFAFDDADIPPDDARALRLRALGVPLFTRGEGELRGDFVFRAPAIRPDTPRLCRAALRGMTVLTEAELFMHLCPARIFAVTGSDGKTTTSSMLASLLETTGRRVYLGGNIGRSLLPFADEMTKEDLCVLELSSFQLTDMDAHASVGVLTNLSPNHLNWHRDMAEYAAAKRRLLSMSDKRVLRTALFEDTAGVRFSADADGDYCCRGGLLWGRGVPLCRSTDLRLPGVHNIENLLAAAAAAEEYIKPSDVCSVARRLAGAPHRMQWVGDVRGVHFYDSSIDTTPSRTAVTLAAMHAAGHRISLLCGGAEKGLSFEPLVLAAKKFRARIYLFGAAEERIAKALREYRVPYTVCGDLGTAIGYAFSHACENETVLLSPACTSFDAFADFEARGEFFRHTVANLSKM